MMKYLKPPSVREVAKAGKLSVKMQCFSLYNESVENKEVVRLLTEGAWRQCSNLLAMSDIGQTYPYYGLMIQAVSYNVV